MRRLFVLCLLCFFSSYVAVQAVPPPSQEQVAAEACLVQAKKKTAALLAALSSCTSTQERLATLETLSDPNESIHKYRALASWYDAATPEEKYALVAVIALDQFDTVFSGFDTLLDKRGALEQLTHSLVAIENFYRPLGGLIGYQDTVLGLFLAKDAPFNPDLCVIPPYIDARKKTPEIWALSYEGIKNLQKTGDLLVLGGSGDRLNLLDEKTKEPLPAACLLFNGTSLFEGLMRDIEAQEYFHYRAFGKQISVPIVIMSSSAKNNDKHIAEMGKNEKWFGHNPDTIRTIIQEQVPMVSLTTGRWLVSSPLTLDMRPGGHGVVWKLAKDTGTFSWLKAKGADAVLVRQVNNPLAGLDNTLSAFVGYGLTNRKAFGFASVPSRPGLSEGLNVLSLKPHDRAAITNIEYTQFTALKNARPDLFKEGVCPANINILFASIPAMERAVEQAPFPGMLVNAKMTSDFSKLLNIKNVSARLECSMQNIADELTSPYTPTSEKNNLCSYLFVQEREKLMSVAKKAFVPNQSPLETPESCYYDLMSATRRVLKEHCAFSVPPEQSFEDFLAKGPAFAFSFNPCLGPFWEVIGQKLHGGSIAPHSDLTLDLAELSCNDLTLDGSLLIKALSPTGFSSKEKGTIFSEKVGRAQLSNVTVTNKGFSSRTASEACGKSQKPKERCEIILEGFSEVVAKDVTISGPLYLFVPNGQRATLSMTPEGELDITFELISSPSWTYAVSWESGKAPRLTLKQG